MAIEYFGDAEAYLRLGAVCARALETGSMDACYHGLRPVGALLYFALAPLLSRDPVTVLYVQVALNVAMFLLLLRAMALCAGGQALEQGRATRILAQAGLLAGGLALAMPFLPVPLSDLPAVTFFLLGVALLTRPGASARTVFAAGLSMGVACLVKQNYYAFTVFAFAAMAFGTHPLRGRRTWLLLAAAAAGAAIALLQPALVWAHTGHFWPFDPAEAAVFEPVRLPNVIELVAFTIPANSAYLSTLDTLQVSPLAHFCIKLLQGFFSFRPAVYLGAAPADSPPVLALTPLLLAKAYVATGALVAGHVAAGIVSSRHWRPVIVLSLAAALFSAWYIHVENRYFLLSKLLIVCWACGWALPAALRRFAASAARAGVWRADATVAQTPAFAPWRPSRKSVVAYVLVLAACFLVFLQSDLLHTVGSSYAYLQGHWKDFYSYNRPLAGRNDYLPGIYLVFATWYAPLHWLGALSDIASLGHVTLLRPAEALWGKLLMALLFAATAVGMHRVGTLVGGGREAGWRAAAVFATAPLAVFPVFVMGQYDIVPVLLMVLALHGYFERRFVLFAALFSLAIPFKYFPAAFFAPLVLLAPVSWGRRLQLAAIGTLGTLVQLLLYGHDKVFRASLFTLPAQRTDIGLLLAAGLLLCLAVCVACALSRWRSPEVWARRAILACCAVAALMFTGVGWNPQWLLLAMPFFALASLDLRRPAWWYAAEVVAVVAFGWLVANRFSGNVDVAMVQQGVLGRFVPDLNLVNSDVMGPLAVPFMRRLFTAFLFLPALLMLLAGGALVHPTRRVEADSWIGGRFHAAMAILLLPTLYCAYASATEAQARLASRSPSLMIGEGTRNVGELLPGRTVAQEVVARGDSLRAVAVRFATYERVNEGEVRIVLSDADGAELAAHTVPALRLKDNQFHAFAIPPQSGSAGRKYVVTVSVTGSRPGAAPTVWIDDHPPTGAGQLLVDGKPQPGALNLQLFDAPR